MAQTDRLGPQRSVATWRCAAFISPCPCNDDGLCYSVLEIVEVIIIIIIIIAAQS